MAFSINQSQVIVFLLTFTSYALYHAARKNLSGVKQSVTDEWLSNTTATGAPKHPLFPAKEDAQNFLGTLDCLFMVVYAMALFFWGWFGDRINPRNVVVFGMIGSAIALFLFGLVPHWLEFYSLSYYVIIYLLFGLVQACGWPNEVTIMANWFPKTNRGLIMGLWAACQPVGNIIGLLIVAFFLTYGYQTTFLVNSILIFVGGIVMFLCINPKPEAEMHRFINRRSSTDALLASVEENYNENGLLSSPTTPTYNTAQTIEPPSVNRPITIFEAICLPSVLPYCLCNAALKFVNYAFFFWLPFYLTTKYEWTESEANSLAIFYDIGGIIGSVCGGSLSDRIHHRSPVLMGMLILSLPTLLVYANIDATRWIHIILMGILGITISGPYNLIVGSISVDLGSQPALAGNMDAMSTVTGLIDGMGSAGSAIGQLFIPMIQNGYGWVFVFYLFIFMNIVAIICLLKRFIHDVRLMIRCWHNNVEYNMEVDPLLPPTRTIT